MSYVYVVWSRSREIDSLTADVASLHLKISKLEKSLDDEDAYVRRQTIIFNGTSIPPSSPGEICSNVIRTVIKEKLKISLQPSDISIAHRVGKKPITQGPDRRGIQVRFCRRETKREIMLTKRDNSDSNSTLYTNESLTPKRRTMLFTLRQMKKKFPAVVKGCTSQEGRVFAFTPAPASPSSIPVRDRKHLIVPTMIWFSSAMNLLRFLWIHFSLPGIIKILPLRCSQFLFI